MTVRSLMALPPTALLSALGALLCTALCCAGTSSEPIYDIGLNQLQVRRSREARACVTCPPAGKTGAESESSLAIDRVAVLTSTD